MSSVLICTDRIVVPVVNNNYDTGTYLHNWELFYCIFHLHTSEEPIYSIELVFSSETKKLTSQVLFVCN